MGRCYGFRGGGSRGTRIVGIVLMAAGVLVLLHTAHQRGISDLAIFIAQSKKPGERIWISFFRKP